MTLSDLASPGAKSVIGPSDANTAVSRPQTLRRERTRSRARRVQPPENRRLLKV